MFWRKPTPAGGSSHSPRRLWPSVAAALLCSAIAAPAAEDVNANAEAIAALQDLKAAVSEIEHAAEADPGGPDHFFNLAQRALNDLIGVADSRYRRADGGSADLSGALVHLNRLSSHGEDAPWASAVNTALVNTQVAVSHLQSALAQQRIDRFQLDLTDALTSLEMALGRSSELGALGGLSGALGTTVLGVPAGARTTAACDQPDEVPAYGIAAGYLVYVALPLNGGQASLPIELNARRVETDGKRLIAYTAAEGLLPALCNRDRAAMALQSAGLRPAVSLRASFDTNGWFRGSGLEKVAARAATQSVPRLYTQKQAQAGRKIYQTQCVSCHGSNLQGTAAPAVAGKDFLETAQRNGWTMEDLRTIVFYNMPFNAPGSLSAEKYADVMAYLLAENCYPAGSKPFPKSDERTLESIPLEVIAQDNDAAQSHAGVCEVK